MKSEYSVRDEVQAMQNPALCAVLLWRFACGFGMRNSDGSKGPLLPLAFLVLPIALHRSTREVAAATRASSGLHRFVQNLTAKKSQDALFGLHSRALALRPLSANALGVAAASGLLAFDFETAEVRAVTRTPPASIGDRVKPLIQASEHFGGWCANLTMFEVATALKVDF